MDMGSGHGMGVAAPPAAAAQGGKRVRYLHMTFFWGKNSEILFTMWPGTRGGMYALALVVIFASAVLLEFLGCRGLESYLSSRDGQRRVAAGVARTAVYTVRIGLAYLLMLVPR